MIARMEGIGIIERAYQLAPECGTIEEVRRRLTQEGYAQVSAHISGPRIRADLAKRLNPELEPKRPRREQPPA
jgi:hypothetical protein